MEAKTGTAHTGFFSHVEHGFKLTYVGGGLEKSSLREVEGRKSRQEATRYRFGRRKRTS